jgi:hypothetical protein
MKRLAWVVVPVTVAVVAFAAVQASGKDVIAAGLPRVRSLDLLAAKVLETAVRASPTVVGLIAELRRGDVIVHVQTGILPSHVNGIMRLVTATATVRYLRVVLRIPSSMPDLVAVLGHELRHAVEIAAMPGVRDLRAFAAAASEMGWPTSGDGFFETKAACDAGRAVWRELAGK